MQSQAKKAAAFIVMLMTCLLLAASLAGCASSASQKQPAKQPAQTTATTKTAHAKKTYSDIPTPYPDLYQYDPNSGLHNVYNEGKVISWTEAGNYIGQAITVEGDVSSVVHAGSSNGSPYFYNLGGEAYEGFAVVVWSEDLAKFDENTLRNDAAWSASDQPLSIRLRVSGVVEMYNGRPQITARDGTQVAEWVNNSWCSMISGNAMDALLESLYR